MPAIPFTKRFRRRYPRFTRVLLLSVCFFGSLAMGLAFASWAMVCRAGRCPPVETLQEYEPRQTSKVLARDGRFIAELGLERRTIVRYANIPPLVRSAFVVTEDKRFFSHAGIDWWRVPGALLVDIRNRNFAEGFSTITMQLARNIFPERISRDKSLVRKLKEAKVARAIETRYSKERILELYLNQIYLGNGAYGIEAASQRYFGKTLKELNLAEVATLAALPKGPERYNPRKYPDRAVQRRNTVIALMRDEKIITTVQASEAQAYPLRLATRIESGEVAPYFVEWIRQQLDEKFGARLYEQGLKVYTTLDLELQTAAERALERQIRAIEAGKFGTFPHVTYERYLARSSDSDRSDNAANSPYLQGAFIAMDPQTGGIRALVGGRDFDDNNFDRAVQAVRQPGSTFKPIVYADAIQNGRPLSYILDDSPLTVEMAGTGTWAPRNFDGDYAGKIPMRRALYQSRNVPTIKLGLELGAQSVIDEARKFGLTTPIPAYPSIFIGAADVYPIEMVAAYSTFATLGTRSQPMAITRVEDQQGTVLWEPQPTRIPVLSPEEAWLMVSAMKDVIQRGTAAGSVGAQIRFPAGGKTGTTNDGTDAWFIGYTSDLVAGVWMGFDKPQKIKANAQGGILAAPVWTAFMNEAYRRLPAPRDWPMPPGIVVRPIDMMTGMIATPYCPSTTVASEFFIPGTDPLQQCDVHNSSTLFPDTSGSSGVFPDSSGRPARGIFPGVPGQIQQGRPLPRDTSRRFRDSAIFALPPRDSAKRDSAKRDSAKKVPRRDTIRPPKIPPDTTR
jgi:penicillin-binding protein 1A